MSTIDELVFKGATFKHKRGNIEFWNQADADGDFLKQGELGILLDSEGNISELKIGRDNVPFSSLKGFKDPESLVDSLTYIDSVSQEGNELTFTDSQGETYVYNVGTGSGDTSSTTVRKLLYKVPTSELTMLPVLNKCTSVPVNFQAASFTVEAENMFVTQVMNTLNYTVTLVQDSTPQILTKKPATIRVGSRKAWAADISWDEEEFPKLESESEYGYEFNHTIDLLPLLRNATIESNKQFSVIIDVYDTATEPNHIPVEQMEFSYIIREPKILGCDYPWHKPVAITDLDSGVNFKFTLSGAVDTTPYLVYSVMNNLGNEVCSDQVRADSSVSGQFVLKSEDFTDGVVPSGAYTLSATLRCTSDGINFIESTPYTVSLIFTDRSTYHITSPLGPVNVTEGAVIEVPFVVSLHSEVTEAIVKCECVDSSGASVGLVEEKKVKHVLDTTTVSEPYSFMITDYPVDQSFTIVLSVQAAEGAVTWTQSAYVTGSELSKKIQDISGYAYEFNATSIKAVLKKWQPTESGRRTVPNAELFGFNWLTDGNQLGADNRTCMRFRGDAGAVLDVGAMNTSAEKTIIFDLAVPVAGDPDTQLIRSYASEDGTGFYLTPTMLKVFINGTTLERRFDTTDRIRVGFTVSESEDPNDKSKCRFIYIYINGVMCGVMPYEISGSGLGKIELGASEDGNIINDAVLDIYSIRQYDRYVSPKEHFQIYNAGLALVTARHETYNRNNLYSSNDQIQYSELSKYIPVVTFIGDLPPGKGYKRTALIHIKYPPDWGRPDELFITKKRGLDVQGTSSAGYRRKNFKFTSEDYYSLIPNELPAKVYCLKVDFAEGTGTHNTQNANITEHMYRELSGVDLPVKNPEMLSTLNSVPVNLEQSGVVVGTAKWTPSESSLENNSKIRTTIAGIPVALYYYTPPLQDLYGSDKPTSGQGETSAQASVAAKYLKDLLSNNLATIKDSDRAFYAKGNLNYDKGAENVFGFTSIVQDTLDINDGSLEEVTTNSHYDTTRPVDVHITPYGVECWEFCKNNKQQDFLCSMEELDNFDTNDADNYFFAAFEPRFHPDWDEYDDLSENRSTVEDENRFVELQGSIPTKFKEMYSWVISTDPNRAPGTQFGNPVTFDGIDYINNNGVSESGRTATYSSDTKGYRYAKFKAELEKHFNKSSLLLYYVYTFYALMVDQRAKNMFLTFWPDNPADPECATGKWYPYFYDNDTSFGIDNKGNLVLEYYNEDFDNSPVEDIDNSFDKFGNKVFAGVESVLWNNLVKLFSEDIHNKYIELRGSTLSSERIYQNVITNGAKKYSETLYNQDTQDKYIASYLEALHGDGDVSNTYHNIKGPEETYLEYFLKYRTWYCDSKWPNPKISSFISDKCPMLYLAGSDAEGSNAVTMKLTSSINCYGTSFYVENSPGMSSGEYCLANQERTVVIKKQGDQAQNLRYYLGIPQAISKIATTAESNIHAQQFTLLNLESLEEIDLSGSEVQDLGVGNHPLLRSFKANDFLIPASSEKTSLNLSGCPSLKFFDASGDTDNWKSITFANTGQLEEVHFPKSATVLSFTNQNKLRVFDIPNECWNSRISAVSITNSSAVFGTASADLAQYCLSKLFKKRAVSGEVADSLKVSIDVHDCNLDFETLSQLAEFLSDTKKLATDLTFGGKCHIVEISDQEEDQVLYRSLRNEFPDLAISYDRQVAKVTYGNTGFSYNYTLTGGNSNTAMKAEVKYPGARPAKDKTDEWTYTFLGWYPGDQEVILYPGTETSGYKLTSFPIYGSCTVWPVFAATKNKYRVYLILDSTSDVEWQSPEYEYNTTVSREDLYRDGCPIITADGQIDVSSLPVVSVEGSLTTMRVDTALALNSVAITYTLLRDVEIRIPYLVESPTVATLPGEIFTVDPTCSTTDLTGTCVLTGIKSGVDLGLYVNDDTNMCIAFPSSILYQESEGLPQYTLEVTDIASQVFNGIYNVQQRAIDPMSAQIVYIDSQHATQQESMEQDTYMSITHRYEADPSMDQAGVDACIPSINKYQPLVRMTTVVPQSGKTSFSLFGSSSSSYAWQATYSTEQYERYLRVTDTEGAELLLVHFDDGADMGNGTCWLAKDQTIELEFGFHLKGKMWNNPIFSNFCSQVVMLTYPLPIRGMKYPSSVKTIRGPGQTGSYASELTDVWYSANTETYVYESAFSNCRKLCFFEPLLTRASSTLHISASGLRNCAFKHLNSNRPLELDRCSFMNCDQLETVNFTKKVTHKQATNSSGNLYNFTYYETYGVFYGCSKLESVSINTAELSPFFFRDCNKLEKVRFNYRYSTIYINQGVFSGCSALKEISVPGSTSPYQIVTDRFSVSKNSSTSPDGYRGHFYKCSNLPSTTLQQLLKGCTNIPDYCFQGCTKLDAFVASENCETIGGAAFGQCTSLRTINLSAATKLSRIGNHSFAWCSSVNELYFPLTYQLGTQLTLCNGAFYGALNPGVEHVIHLPKNVYEVQNRVFGSETDSGMPVALDVYLDEWHTNQCTYDKYNPTEIIEQKVLPVYPGRMFDWNYKTFGTLHGALSHSVAEGIDTITFATTRYYWGAKTVNYVDEEGSDAGQKVFGEDEQEA